MHIERTTYGTIAGAALLLLAGASWLYFGDAIWKSPSPERASTTGGGTPIAHGPCLEAGEYAEYPRKSDHPDITEPQSIPFSVIVFDKKSGEESVRINVTDLIQHNGYPIELRRCGIYATKGFNVDYGRAQFLSGFNFSLWKYDYGGSSNKMLTFTEKIGEEIKIYYAPSFRIDLNEKNISLIRGYLGKPDYALVIKDLPSLADAFTLTIQDIEKQDPSLVQDISFSGGGWSRDGRYFWADTHYGANTLAFIRIDMQEKSFRIFPSPRNVLGGDALNLDRGLTTVHPGNAWYGIAEITEEEKTRRRKEGIGTELYIHDLASGTRQFVASTTEPLWFYQPRWISETELRYVTPEGETKIYTVR